MMSSQQSCRRASSVSPGSAGKNSTNIGVIPSGQPSRSSESVPSKSKSTWLTCGRAAKPGANSIRPWKAVVDNIQTSFQRFDVQNQGLNLRLREHAGITRHPRIVLLETEHNLGGRIENRFAQIILIGDRRLA